MLNNVAFELHEGQLLVICGKSGAGKTTLVRILAGLVDFDSGEIELGDFKINHSNNYEHRLYGKIGVLFQQHNLFPHLNALDNVALALKVVKKYSKQKASQLANVYLEQVNMLHKKDSFPHQLSGGEAQRVAIARALAIEPEFFLLDEPTSHLDPSLVAEVLTTISELAKSGKPILLITHNIEFAKRVGNKFGLLENGKLTVSDSSEIFDSLNSFWC